MTALKHKVALDAAWTALYDARADACAVADRHLEGLATAAELRTALEVVERARKSWLAMAEAA